MYLKKKKNVFKKKKKEDKNTYLQVVQTNKNFSAYYTEKRRHDYITLNRMKCAHFIHTKWSQKLEKSFLYALRALMLEAD